MCSVAYTARSKVAPGRNRAVTQRTVALVFIEAKVKGSMSTVTPLGNYEWIPFTLLLRVRV